MAVTVSLIETPQIVALAGNQINVIAETSLTGLNSLSIHLAILTYNGSAWVETGKEDAVDVVAGRAEFNLSGYFEDLFSAKFTHPAHFSNLVVEQAGMMVDYRLQLWETYVDSNSELVSKKTAESLITDSTLHIAPGAISEYDEAMLNTLSTDWWTEWIAGQRFQTWMPETKTTTRTAAEKLYWIARRTATETITIAYTNTLGASSIFTKTAYMTAYRMYELCVDAALIEVMAGSTLASYSITIAGQSVTIDYEIDDTYYEREEFFLMQNPFDCYESLWCRGFAEGEIEISRLQYERSLPARYLHTDRKLGTTKGNLVRTRKSNTGYMQSENWYNWAVSLLAGADAWIYSPTTIAPIALISEKVVYIDDLRDIWSLEIEWKHSREGRFGGSLGLALEYIAPPYLSKLSAFFYRTASSVIIDKINNLQATLSGANVTWPNIAGNDVLDFSDATFWDQTLIAATAWYNGAAPRTCPLAWMEGAEWAEAGTDATHARLFHRDYTGATRSILPVLVYASNLTEDEQGVVVDWLDWYFTIWESGSILTENDNILIQ